MAIQTDLLLHYITTADSYPKLTQDDVLFLVKRWTYDRDHHARQVILCAHLRSVVTIARRYRRYGLPLADLGGEGNIGVLYAMQRFDVSHGTRFVTYATHWIRARILSHVIRSWSMVSGGSGVMRSRMFLRLCRERVRIVSLVGSGELADDMLARVLDVTPTALAAMIARLDARDLSIDTTVQDDSGASLVDTLPASTPGQKERLMSSQILAGTRCGPNGAWLARSARALHRRQSSVGAR